MRIAETVALDGIAHRGLTASPFAPASTMQRFDMPDDVLGIVHDKSTSARRGVAVRDIPIEPGWRGFLTLELTNHGRELVVIEAGTPVARIVFHRLDEPAERPCAGRYQDQKAGPQPARLIE